VSQLVCILVQCCYRVGDPALAQKFATKLYGESLVGAPIEVCISCAHGLAKHQQYEAAECILTARLNAVQQTRAGASPSKRSRQEVHHRPLSRTFLVFRESM
jgi:hypothetical protein